MRIVNNLEQYGHYQIIYVDMTESERLIVKDLKDDVSAIIDHFVSEMVENQQFKEQTQEVADFIETIAYSIESMQFETKYASADQEEKRMLIANELKNRYEQWRESVVNHLYAVKAKAAGLNVSDAEFDAWLNGDEKVNFRIPEKN